MPRTASPRRASLFATVLLATLAVMLAAGPADARARRHAPAPVRPHYTRLYKPHGTGVRLYQAQAPVRLYRRRTRHVVASQHPHAAAAPHARSAPVVAAVAHAAAPLAAAARKPEPVSQVASAAAAVHINNLAYDRAHHSLVLDITAPVTISTRSLKGPPRLVVDIPAASLESHNREVEVHDDLIKRVRISQWQIYPPTVRIVIETAVASEPLIAVQQTAKQLFITLAPARPGEENPRPAPSAAPTPRPSATPRPEPTANWQTPQPASPKPTPMTHTRLLPRHASPAPVARPSAAPTPAPVLPSPEPIDGPAYTPEPSAPILEMPAPTPTPRMTPYNPTPMPGDESLPQVP